MRIGMRIGAGQGQESGIKFAFHHREIGEHSYEFLRYWFPDGSAGIAALRAVPIGRMGLMAGQVIMVVGADLPDEWWWWANPESPGQAVTVK